VVWKHQVISGSSRLVLPPERWTDRVPARWRVCVPHYVTLPNGEEVTVTENSPFHEMGHTRITVKSTDHHGMRDMPGDEFVTWSPEERLRRQDEDGVDAEIMYTDPYSQVFLGMVAGQGAVEMGVMYTHPVSAGFWRGVREDAGYKAIIHAYNKYLGEEYCAANPSRLIALGVIPDTGVDDAIAEMDNCVRAGLRAVALHRFPSGKGYPTQEDDRFWRAALEMKVPLTLHRTGGTVKVTRDVPNRFPWGPADWSRERDLGHLLLPDDPVAPLQMCYAGVFDRFPKLRVYWPELHVGWLPNLLLRIDDEYERSRHWGDRFYWGERFHGIDPMAHYPSYYLKKQCFWGFANDADIVNMRWDIGVNQLIWRRDSSRTVARRLGSRDMIEDCLALVPADERYRMLAGNAIEFFNLKDETVETEQPAYEIQQHGLIPVEPRIVEASFPIRPSGSRRQLFVFGCSDQAQSTSLSR